jgi:hypothetical protein
MVGYLMISIVEPDCVLSFDGHSTCQLHFGSKLCHSDCFDAVYALATVCSRYKAYHFCKMLLYFLHSFNGISWQSAQVA